MCWLQFQTMSFVWSCKLLRIFNGIQELGKWCLTLMLSFFLQSWSLGCRIITRVLTTETSQSRVITGIPAFPSVTRKTSTYRVRHILASAGAWFLCLPCDPTLPGSIELKKINKSDSKKRKLEGRCPSVQREPKCRVRSIAWAWNTSSRRSKWDSSALGIVGFKLSILWTPNHCRSGNGADIELKNCDEKHYRISQFLMFLVAEFWFEASDTLARKRPSNPGTSWLPGFELWVLFNWSKFTS